MLHFSECREGEGGGRNEWEGQTFTVAPLAHMRDWLDGESPPTRQLCPCFCPLSREKWFHGKLRSKTRFSSKCQSAALYWIIYIVHFLVVCFTFHIYLICCWVKHYWEVVHCNSLGSHENPTICQLLWWLFPLIFNQRARLTHSCSRIASFFHSENYAYTCNLLINFVADSIFF